MPPAVVSVRKLPSEGEEARYEVLAGGKAHTVSLNQGVWNPGSYQSLAKAIFPSPDATPLPLSDLECAKELLSPSLQTFIAQNKRISLFLTGHPASASGQVQAALLVGTIALNDYSGQFRDVRIPLNRVIAHLAAADALGMPASAEGRQLAEAIRLTLCGQQADALVSLKDFGATQNKTDEEWAAVLRLRNTCDYRQDRERALAGSDALKHEYFRAVVHSVGAGAGVQFLKDAGIKPDAGYWRIANEIFLSVEHGHIFTKPVFGIEFQESATAADAFGIKVVKGSFEWFKQYADIPEGSPLGEESGHATIDVAGRNLLAGYHQRHLMQAAQKMFGFLNDDWGVSDQAKEFKAFIDGRLPETRYTPFLKRMIARDDADRRAANKPCESIISEHPEMVTPTLWMALRDDENQKWILPFPDHHAWFHPEVPRETAFDVGDRLYEIGIGDENNSVWLKTLLDRAPYSYPLARQNAYRENGSTFENLSPTIARKWLSALGEFNLKAMRMLASSYEGQPELYQKAMEKAAALDPDLYLELGDYLEERGLHEKAAQAYLQAFEKADDRVYMANKSLPLVKYLYEKGDLAMATKVAEAADEVYSYRGLDAHIWLLEKQGKWQEAAETARKIDERYNGDSPVAEAAGLIRIASSDMTTAKMLGYDKKLTAVFPSGVKKAVLADFTAAPTRGVLIQGSSPQMVPFGLEANMVIVALNGFRTDTFAQYRVIRECSSDPQMTLIVWDGKAYRVSDGTLPDRKFQVEMADYAK